MNKKPVVIHSLDLKEAHKISNQSNLESIPVVNEDNKLLGLFSKHSGSFISFKDKKISQKTVDKGIVALIMAGGEGKGLDPTLKSSKISRCSRKYHSHREKY